MTFLSRFDFISILMLPSFWIGLATVVIVTLVVYWLFTYLLNMVLKGARNWSEKQEGVGRLQHVVVDMLRRTSKFLLFVAALLFSLRFVDLPDHLFNTLGHAWFLVLAIQIALWLDQGVVSWMRHLMFSPNTSKNPVTMVIAGLLLRMMLWTMMLLSILANVGVNITALVASLGVGGIAIALAVQTILSDVFASLSIGFDKPFEIGDFVVFGDVAGTIEHIGLKTTRIRSLSGEQIVCGNAILLQQTLHNYKRMQTRRIVFTFGLALTTPPEKLRKVGEMVRSIITDVGNTRFDRAHFLGFGTDRLNFEVVHIVNSADYNTYMDIQQEINIRIMEHLAAEEIELALPCVVVKGGVAVETPPAEPQGEQTAV